MNWFSRPASDTQITHGSRLWLYVIGVLGLVFLVVPTLIVIPMSFSASQYLEFPPKQFSLRWYESYFQSRSWMQATITSFQAAGLTVLLLAPDVFWPLRRVGVEFHAAQNGKAAGALAPLGGLVSTRAVSR